MFGYIIVNKGEMKFKEFDLYHSYYCGLCRELKEACGLKGQLTLTYDMTFLVLLLTGLYELDTVKKKEKCVVHPLESHESRRNACSAYVADMNLLMAYYQCRDDWQDERKLKKYAMYKLLSSYCDGLKKKYPEKLSKIEESMEQLLQGEKENCQDIDRMAGCFGTILGEIFAWKKDEWEGHLRRLGFYLGKYIYLLDAYEDIEADKRNGSFNPLQKLQSTGNFDEECQKILTMMMAECCKEFEKLPIIENVEIMRNILYSGVWSRYYLIKKRNEEKHE